MSPSDPTLMFVHSIGLIIPHGRRGLIFVCGAGYLCTNRADFPDLHVVPANFDIEMSLECMTT